VEKKNEFIQPDEELEMEEEIDEAPFLFIYETKKREKK